MSKEAIAIEALEALARLGNGDQYGNSTGNVIARTALFEMAEQPAQQEPVAYLVTGPYEKRTFPNLDSANAYCSGLNKGWGEKVYTVNPLYTSPQAQPAREPLTDEQIDRVLDTRVPGGSEARDWFLPHEQPMGLANVRTVVRSMLQAAHGIMKGNT